MEPQWSVVLEHLTKDFDSFRAVNDVSLQVPEGEMFGFLGPNGAGKTTTIKMMVGLLRPSYGRAVVAGYDVTQDPLSVKARVGLLPEQLNLYERLTGPEYVEFAGVMYGLSREESRRRTEELLGLMELDEEPDKMIVDYSMGMKKKTALAAALIHDPKVLFLDEPFTGIDAVSSRAIRNVLFRLRERGTTIFFSSHVLEVVERLTTRAAIINRGSVVAQGTLPELAAAAGLEAGASLEEVFLRLVGAEVHQEELSWISSRPSSGSSGS
ncbi:MAG: ABC transporter ATP-binding protein [Armatimonadota bacterium]